MMKKLARDILSFLNNNNNDKQEATPKVVWESFEIENMKFVFKKWWISTFYKCYFKKLIDINFIFKIITIKDFFY